MRLLRVSVNGFEANVLQVIKAKRGFIYKIDNILPYRWNPGPSVVKFVQHTPNFVKVDFLIQRLPRKIRDQASGHPIKLPRVMPCITLWREPRNEPEQPKEVCAYDANADGPCGSCDSIHGP